MGVRKMSALAESSEQDDFLAVEEPLEIRIGLPTGGKAESPSYLDNDADTGCGP